MADTHFGQVSDVLSGQHAVPVPGHEDQMDVQGANHVPAPAVAFIGCHRPMAYARRLAAAPHAARWPRPSSRCRLPAASRGPPRKPSPRCTGTLTRCKLSAGTVRACKRQAAAYAGWLAGHAGAHGDALADLVGAKEPSPPGSGT